MKDLNKGCLLIMTKPQLITRVFITVGLHAKLPIIPSFIRQTQALLINCVTWIACHFIAAKPEKTFPNIIKNDNL